MGMQTLAHHSKGNGQSEDSLLSSQQLGVCSCRVTLDHGKLTSCLQEQTERYSPATKEIVKMSHIKSYTATITTELAMNHLRRFI